MSLLDQAREFIDGIDVNSSIFDIDKSVTVLKQQLESITKERDKAIEETILVREVLVDYDKQFDSIEKERDKAIEENKQLHTVIEVYDKRCNTYKTQCARVSSLSQHLGHQYENLIKEYDVLKQLYEDGMKRHQEVIDDLNDKLNSVCTRRDEVEWANLDLIEECDELTDRLHDTREDAFTEVQELRDKIACLEEENKSNLVEVEKARPVYEENERKIGSLTRELYSMQCNYEILKQMYTDECELSHGYEVYKELYLHAKHELKDIKKKIAVCEKLDEELLERIK